MARSPKLVYHLLHEKPSLQRLERELNAQKMLLTDVRQCLPADLAQHCAAAQLRERTLVLHTDSPAWATRLRYLAPQLISVLADEYPALREIKVRLLIEQSAPPPPKNAPRRSDDAARIIRASAGYAKPGPLADALRRLGEALKSR